MSDTELTAEEFERQYAQRSGTTVEHLRSRGRVVLRCCCGDDLCRGWQSIKKNLADEMERDWRDGLAPPPDWIEDE